MRIHFFKFLLAVGVLTGAVFSQVNPSLSSFTLDTSISTADSVVNFLNKGTETRGVRLQSIPSIVYSARSAVESREMPETVVRVNSTIHGLNVNGGDAVVVVNSKGIISSLEGYQADTIPAYVEPTVSTKQVEEWVLQDLATSNSQYFIQSDNLEWFVQGKNTILVYHVVAASDKEWGRWHYFMRTDFVKNVVKYNDLMDFTFKTFNCNNSTSLPGILMYQDNIVLVDEPSAYITHGLTKQTLDYFLATHGWDGINGQGMEVRSSVHFYNKYNNAAWTGTQMIYGDGDGIVLKYLGEDIDVVSHELGHGVMQYTADLYYFNQSGALNESYSDLWSMMLDRSNYLMGERCYTPGQDGDALRYFDNPELGRQPKNMDQYFYINYDNGGVHFNSGIMNYAWYLMITELGRDKVERIAFRALKNYLTSLSSFSFAGNALLKAANDLYPGDEAVKNAISLAMFNTGIFVHPTDNRFTQSTTVNVNIAHPYQNNDYFETSVTLTNSYALRICFQNFETEPSDDYVKIYDKNNILQATYSGSLGDFNSAPIPGDTVKIVFKSDGNVTGNGFDIYQIAYVPSENENPIVNLVSGDMEYFDPAQILITYNVVVSDLAAYEIIITGNNYNISIFSGTSNIYGGTCNVTADPLPEGAYMLMLKVTTNLGLYYESMKRINIYRGTTLNYSIHREQFGLFGFRSWIYCPTAIAYQFNYSFGWYSYLDIVSPSDNLSINGSNGRMEPTRSRVIKGTPVLVYYFSGNYGSNSLNITSARVFLSAPMTPFCSLFPIDNSYTTNDVFEVNYAYYAPSVDAAQLSLINQAGLDVRDWPLSANTTFGSLITLSKQSIPDGVYTLQLTATLDSQVYISTVSVTFGQSNVVDTRNNIVINQQTDTAYPDIQTALDNVADGQTIMVKPGIYFTDKNTELTWPNKSNVTLTRYPSLTDSRVTLDAGFAHSHIWLQYNVSLNLSDISFTKAGVGVGVINISTVAPADGSMLIVSRCIFSDNQTGIVYSSSNQTERCSFYDSQFLNNTGNYSLFTNQSNMYVNNCRFENNQALNGSIAVSSSFYAINSTFERNSAQMDGGLMNSCNFSATQCLFKDNQAGQYGALAYNSFVSLNNALVLSNNALDCIFSNPANDVSLIHDTFSNPSTPLFGEISTPLSVTVINSLIKGNLCNGVTPPTFNITASALSDATPPAKGAQYRVLTNMPDSVFINIAAGDYHLSPSSNYKVIDQGINSGRTEPDLDGSPRVYGSASDLGAYEYHGDYVWPIPTSILPVYISTCLAGPNPFHIGQDTCHLLVLLNRSASVKITIVSLNGRVIRVISGQGYSGSNNFVWDGRSSGGELINSGGYYAYIKVTDSAGNVASKMLKIAGVR